MAKIVDQTHMCDTPGCSPSAVRECRSCGEEKSLPEAFYLTTNPVGKRYHMRQCRGCYCNQTQRWSYENPEKQKESERRHRAKGYGLTLEEYDKLMTRRCEICGNESEHLDHDHESGAVRGALCAHCNRGLGYFGDDPDRLLSAAMYLMREGVDHRQDS